MSVGLDPGVPATGPFSIDSWKERAAVEGDAENDGVGGEGSSGARQERDASEKEDSETEQRTQVQSGGGGNSLGVGLWSFAASASASAAGGGECVSFSAAHALVGGITGRQGDVYYAQSLSNGDSYFTAARVAAMVAMFLGVLTSSIIWYMASTFGFIRNGDNAINTRGSNPMSRLCSSIPKDLLLQLVTAQLLVEGVKFGVTFNIQLCTAEIWTTVNLSPGGPGRAPKGFVPTDVEESSSSWGSEAQWERNDSSEYHYEASMATESVEGDFGVQYYGTTRANECILSRGAVACLGAMVCCFVSMIMILGFILKPSHRHEGGGYVEEPAAVSPEPQQRAEEGCMAVTGAPSAARDEWADEIINGESETSSVPSFLLSLGWSSLGSRENNSGGSKSQDDRTGRRTRTSKSSNSSSSGSGSWENYLRWKERRRKERIKKERREYSTERRSSRRRASGRSSVNSGAAGQGRQLPRGEGDSGRIRPDGQVAESVARRVQSVDQQSDATSGHTPSAAQGSRGGNVPPINRRGSNETERTRNFGARSPYNRRGSNETERVRNFGGSSQPYGRRRSNETDGGRSRRSSNESINRRGSIDTMNRRGSNESMNRRGSNETMNRRSSNGTINRRASNETERTHNLGGGRRASARNGQVGRSSQRRSSGHHVSRVDDTEWTCKACTCLNPPTCLACVACGTTRGERPSRSRYETDMSTVTFERSEKYGIE